MLAALDAQRMLADEWDVGADVWSATSYKTLREDALSTERWNRLHPTEPARTPYVTELLGDAEGPVVAVTDFMKALPDGVGRFVPKPFVALGTDGYGFSDTRGRAPAPLRSRRAEHRRRGAPGPRAARMRSRTRSSHEAIARYDIDPDKIDPRLA